MRKTIYLLNIDNYAPEITEITYPFIQRYARKCHADVYVISERKFHGWPVVYEKLQIYELAKKREDEWSIYIDSDAMIHPETLDFTNYLPKDTVLHRSSDPAGVRWSFDKYFLRDGRNISSGNWFTIASDWCLDLWHPLDDLTLEEALDNIHPMVQEINAGITKEHFIDDYTLSRNIARYGLKFTTVKEMLPKLGMPQAHFFYHEYLIPREKKAEQVRKCLDVWEIK